MEKNINKNTKILIVDDDNFLLDMYAIKFKESGYEVQTALGSIPALEILKKGFSPDVVLTDILMPEIDGFEFLQKIKDEKLSINAIYIILSNMGEEDDIKKGDNLNVNGYIIKADTTPSEVMEYVKKILEKNNKK